MTTPSNEILTPVGRLVGGNPFEPRTTDSEGKPLLTKTGANAGQPRVEYYMAIAIEKNAPGVMEMWNSIVTTAKQGFPAMFDASGNCINPKFSFKMTDGDSTIPDGKGNRPCDKPGYAGCYVFRFSSGYAPKCYTNGGQAAITDPSAIKLGYYIRIFGAARPNGSQQQPGVYLDPRMIELVGYGEEITLGSTGAVFGNNVAEYTPAGMSSTPPAPATTNAAMVPAHLQQQQAPGMQQAPQQAPQGIPAHLQQQQPPQQAPQGIPAHLQQPQQAPQGNPAMAAAGAAMGMAAAQQQPGMQQHPGMQQAAQQHQMPSHSPVALSPAEMQQHGMQQQPQQPAMLQQQQHPGMQQPQQAPQQMPTANGMPTPDTGFLEM